MGYIGAVLVPFFRAAGHEVDGLDLGLYEGCDLGPALLDTQARRPTDMRDVMAGHLAGYDGRCASPPFLTTRLAT